MSDYGGIYVTTNILVDDQIVEAKDWDIEASDKLIGISANSLVMGSGHHYHTDDAGNLVILGQLTYRPTRFDHDGRIIVCQRVQEPT